MSHLTPWLLHAERLLDQRNLSAALSCFNVAERKGADPDRCAAGRWMVAMLQGRFAEAWRESDGIRRRGATDPHRFWNGESIRGQRVIVRCLHGFGDTVQSIRYLPALRRIASHLILEVAPRMLELAKTFPGPDEVVAWGDAAPAHASKWDVQMEITELPYFFRTRTQDLPVGVNYLHLPQGIVCSAARAFGSSNGTRVGVVWSSGEWDQSRSIPLARLVEMLQDPEFSFWNLQGGAVRNQWNSLTPATNLHDAPEFCADAGLVPLAAFMQQLDLVITVDTLAAHLGGALGIPTWLMLQHSADWRWMLDRDDSPWYPSMRIFRQLQQDDWASVADQVRQALAQWHVAGMHTQAA